VIELESVMERRDFNRVPSLVKIHLACTMIHSLDILMIVDPIQQAKPKSRFYCHVKF
jgi:hypothetical protein